MLNETESNDPLYEEAKATALKIGYVSLSQLQRYMRTGFARTAMLIDAMERDGWCGSPDPLTGRRPILKQNARAQKAHKRLQLVKAFILARWKAHYCAPTSREIAIHFKTSTSVVATWLIKLEDEKWIIPRPGPDNPMQKAARQIIPAKVVEILQRIPE